RARQRRGRRPTVSATCHVSASPRRFDTFGPGALAAGHGPHDQERLGARRDSLRQGCIRRLIGEILLAAEEPDERPALLGDVVANRSPQHRVGGLERVEDRALRDLPLDVELHLAVDVRERPEMRREHDPDHGSVWTSTETTAGRSRTMGAQRSPALAEAYTWPPVVPKYTPHGLSEPTAIASRSTLTKQLLWGRPLVSSSHSFPPARLRYTRSFPSGGMCSESLLMGTT